MTPNLQRIYDKALDVLGSEDKALDWIEHMSATLKAKPKDLAQTEEGTLRVLLHLASVSRHSLT